MPGPCLCQDASAAERRALLPPALRSQPLVNAGVSVTHRPFPAVRAAGKMVLLHKLLPKLRSEGRKASGASLGKKRAARGLPALEGAARRAA